ncbi:hypothetical protein ACFXKC_12220 [Streptomyces sp. NPDC059340]|uniref:hypothetical protein n=1 Tax=Streptomyces sp. NPDC059340 TaxID=3346806 RepID=UPI00368586DD
MHASSRKETHLAGYVEGRWIKKNTQDSQERRARLRIIPHLGQLSLRNITATDLRVYVAKLESTVSSVDYQRGILSELSSIPEAAVDDERIARNPMYAKSVRWPKAPQERREVCGLSPSSVAEELKRQVEAFPPVEVELPWGKPEGQGRKFLLLRTTRLGNAVVVNTPRRTASMCCGISVYASIMLEAGESVVRLARWLGHSSPAITLGYYAHLMPEAGSKGRTVIDGLLGEQGKLHASRNSPDSPPGSMAGDSHGCAPAMVVADCKVEETSCLGKC